jgi:16S rRNA (uracil1498-N3)-methyltransferase
MRRFFVPPELSRQDSFDLPEREARHAIQVLRLCPGDGLTVMDGAGGVLSCRLDHGTKRTARVVVHDRRQLPPLPCPITLVQAVPKGPAFENIVQKATELGAARIVPLLSDRVVAHIHPEDADSKVEKWKQIGIESIKQCGSPWLPAIEKPVRFEHFPHQHSATGFAVVCSLEERARTVRQATTDYITWCGCKPDSVTVWIGPEGDFTPAEYSRLGELGVTAVSLGTLVLRADTAAIAILAVLNHEFQNLQHP